MPITKDGQYYRPIVNMGDYLKHKEEGFKIQFDCNDDISMFDTDGWVSVSKSSFIGLLEQGNPKYKFRALWDGNIEDMP